MAPIVTSLNGGDSRSLPSTDKLSRICLSVSVCGNPHRPDSASSAQALPTSGAAATAAEHSRFVHRMLWNSRRKFEGLMDFIRPCVPRRIDLRGWSHTRGSEGCRSALPYSSI